MGVSVVIVWVPRRLETVRVSCLYVQPLRVGYLATKKPLRHCGSGLWSVRESVCAGCLRFCDDVSKCGFNQPKSSV
eukprot:COSAG01_NODE_433_length_17113_cov_23.009757_13_plen_76_part_00